MLGIDERFVGRDVQVEIGFMHAAKRAQERAERRPRSFTTVAMDFAYAITIVIACPFSLSVTDRFVLRVDIGVVCAFVGKQQRAVGRQAGFNNLSAGRTVGVGNHPIAAFATFAADNANNGWTVIGIRAPTSLLIGAAARWIGWVGMRGAFFPPRSDTVHRLRSGCLPSPLLEVCQTDWIEYAGVSR